MHDYIHPRYIISLAYILWRVSRWIKRDRARMLSHVHPLPPIIVDIRHTRMWTPAHVVSRLCYIMYVCIHGRMPGWITDGHVCGWNIVVSVHGTVHAWLCVSPVHIHGPLYRIMSWVMCFLRILEEVNATASVDTLLLRLFSHFPIPIVVFYLLSFAFHAS